MSWTETRVALARSSFEEPAYVTIRVDRPEQEVDPGDGQPRFIIGHQDITVTIPLCDGTSLIVKAQSVDRSL